MDDWNVWTLWKVCVFPFIAGVIGWHFPCEVTDFHLAWIRHIMYPDV